MLQEQNSVTQKREDQEPEEILPLVSHIHYKDPFRFLLLDNRFCNLILFVIMLLFSLSSYYGLSVVAVQVQQVRRSYSQLYSISITEFYWYSSGYLLSAIFISIPASEVVARKGARFALMIGVSFFVAGSWLTVLINHSFVSAFVGQYFMGTSYIFFINSMTHLSAHWFGPQDRACSTSTVEFFSRILLSVCLFFPSLVINKEHIPPEDESDYRHRLFTFYLIQAIIFTVLGVICWAFYREKPREHVSPSSMRRRMKSCEAFKMMAKKPSVVLLLIHISSISANTVAFALVMAQAFKEYGATSHSLGLFSLVALPLSLIGIVVGARFSGYTGQFKLVLSLLSLLPLVFMFISLVFRHHHVLYGLILISLFIAQSLVRSLGYELLAELSFPVCKSEIFILAEASSSGVAGSMIRLGQLCLVQICSLILAHNGHEAILWLFLVMQTLSFLSIVFVKEELGRRDLDLYQPNPTGNQPNE